MFNIITALYFLSAAISLGLTFVFWKRRDAGDWVLPSLVIALSTAVWAFGQGMELYVPTLEAKLFWGHIQYLGIVWLSPAWFVLAVGRTNGRKWLSRRFYMGLAVIPVITIFLIFTNRWHQMVWSSVTLNTDFLFPVLDISYGAWFIVQTFYAVGLQMMGIVALIGSHGRHSKVYRQQNFILLIALLIPISTVILRLIGIAFFTHVDVTPLLLTISTILLALFTLTFRLFDIAPVARLMVLNNLSVGIIILNEQNLIVEINPAARTILGIPTMDLTGQDASRLYELRPELAPVCASGIYTHEEIQIRVDDDVHHYDVDISAMEDDAGNANGRILTLTNITERKTAEATIRENERRYQLLADNATDMIWTLDTNLQPNYVNPSVTRHRGYTPEEAITHTLEQTLPPSSIKKIMSIFSQAKKAMETMTADELRDISYTTELENYCKDGSVIAVDVNMSFLLDQEGNPLGLIGTSHNITERKQAEEATQQQNKFLNTIIDSLANPFYVIDVEDYSIQIANKAARDLGVRTTNTCYALTHLRDTPCDGLEHPCPLTALRNAKEPVTVEHIHFDADGKPRNMEVHAYPIFNDAGEVVQMIEYSLDITERKKAEAKFRQLSRAVEQSGSSIVITNLEGEVEFVNPAFTRTVGYEPEEVIGQNPRILQSGQHSPEFYQDMWAVLMQGETWHGEMINKKKDGSLYWEHATISPITDTSGATTGYLAIKDDITERKQTEEKIRQLSRAVEQSASTIVITDLDGNIEFVNPAFCRTTGYTTEEAIGQNPRVLQSGKHDPAFYLTMWKTLLAGETWQGEMLNKKKDGTLFWEHATLSPITDTDGEITHYLAIKDDVTERKRVEAEAYLLLSLSDVMHNAADASAALKAAISLTGEHMGWEFGEVWIPNTEQTLLINSGHSYCRQEENAALNEFRQASLIMTFAPNEGLPGRIWVSREREWHQDISAESEVTYHRVESARKAGFFATLGIPIMAKDEVLAVAVFYMNEVRAENERSVEVITAVATQLGAVLQQKLAQAALVENEYQLRRLTDNISDIILQADRHGILEYITPSCTTTLGYLEEEVLGTSVFDYMPAEDAKAVMKAVFVSMKTGQPIHTEFNFQHKEGHRLYISASGTPLMSEKGRLTGTVFGMTDITKRKRAEDNLQVAYQGIETKVAELTAVNSLIQELSRTTNLQQALNIVTRAMVDQLDSFQCRIALFNEEKTALILAAQYSKSTGKLVSVDTSIPLAGNLHSQRVFETGAPVYIAHAQTTPDTEPSTRQLMQELGVGSMLLLPLLASGEVIGTIAVDSELPDRAFSDEEIQLAETIAAQIANAIANARLSSEEKAAQEKLQVAYEGIEEKVEELTAVNTLIQAMSRTTNLQDALNLVSRTMAELLDSFQCGITLLNEEKTDMVVAAQYTTNPDRPDPIGISFPMEGNIYTKQVFETHKPVYMPNAQTNLDVEPFTRQIMREQGIGSTLLIPLLARGEVIGSIGVDSELPDRAFSDEEIRLAETIAAQIANAIATARLLSEQKKAQQEAEEANKAKSLFLANMSHELRTPMNAILGFAQLMQRDPEITPTQEDRLQTIGRSGEHLLELINDVLEMSKIEAGRMDLDETSFDLHKLLEDVVTLLIMKAQEKNLSLDMQYPADLPQFIRADEPKLRQVLINLVGNAIKFTKEGGVQVSVQHSEGKKDVSPRTTDTGFLQHQNYTLTFTVTDSGSGVDADELATIFDPFIQAKNKHGQQGTGLGLPISRRFVQMMDGDMYAENQLEGGSIFTFDIQATSAAAGDVMVTERLRQVIGLADGQKAYRILLVEDNETNRSLLTQLLEPVGFNVHEAENGRVAINHAKRWKPDLILMDMRMPVMDGLEATRRIKAEQPDIPIIALTAGAFAHNRTEATAAGCDDFMTKPVNVQILFQLLKKYAGVKFIYADEKGDEPEDVDAPLTVEDMVDISPALRQELHTAIIIADRRQAGKVVDEIRKENGRLADKLDALLKAFQFDQLAQLTE